MQLKAHYCQCPTSVIFLENGILQVVLVGHSIGGACISYAMEHFSQKISKAIFLCATMVTDGQRPFDVFADQVSSHTSLICVPS